MPISPHPLIIRAAFLRSPPSPFPSGTYLTAGQQGHTAILLHTHDALIRRIHAGPSSRRHTSIGSGSAQASLRLL